jgi:hypothetical protein
MTFTAGGIFDVNATGAVTVDTAGAIDISVAGNVTLDSSGGTIGIGVDADAQNINVAQVPEQLILVQTLLLIQPL